MRPSVTNPQRGANHLIEHRPRVSVVGLGYVGLCTAVTFAARGFDTLGVDVDSEKVTSIGAGRTPIYEPDLDKMLKGALRKNRLKVTEDISSVAATDVVFITVGTPSGPGGSIDLGHVERAIRHVGASLRNENDYRLLVVRSTVTPGTTRSIVKPALEEASGKRVGVQLGLCANPEFLREGSAIHDALHPDKLVIGGIDEESANRLVRLYRALYGRNLPPTIVTTPETAELIKYASNGFLAAKVSYINTIANIAQLVPGVDVEKVAEGIGLDPRIGPHFLKAGPGYGGSCFHKDLRALIAFGRERGYDPRFLEVVEEVNELQASKVVDLSERLAGPARGKRIAVLGLAFKGDTDDVRESASFRVIERLKEKGARVVTYDPMAIPNARKVLGDSVEFASDEMSAIRGADCCIVMTEWERFLKLKAKDFAEEMRSPNLLDARRLYRPEEFEGVNFAAVGHGGDGIRPEGAGSAPVERPAPSKGLEGYKALITAGGIGTRLLPFSKEIPKEMFPILAPNGTVSPELKPVIQAIFEQLHGAGIRAFYIVIGRGKRAIEDHFSPDNRFVEFLDKKGRPSDRLTSFYDKVRSSHVVFLNQMEPRGFGDAVSLGRPVINGDFLVQAADTFILSKNNEFLGRLAAMHQKYRASATVLLQDVPDPRRYGVVEGDRLEDGVLRITSAEEKPKTPKSNHAIMPVYIYTERIFDALAGIQPDRGGEVQLTSAIQSLVTTGDVVIGVTLKSNELRLDFGSPETMIEALKASLQFLQLRANGDSGAAEPAWSWSKARLDESGRGSASVDSE